MSGLILGTMMMQATMVVKSVNAIKRNSCALCPLHSLGMDKKKSCCKEFKHGKRCKKCPGKKKG
jgi:hypothetical protein